MADIGFYDLIGFLVEYLSKELNVSVSTELPEPLPKEYVTLRRIGGVSKDIRNDTPQIAVRVRSDSEANAWSLTQRLRQAIKQTPAISVDILHVTESSCSVSNPESKAHRGYYLLYFFTTTL